MGSLKRVFLFLIVGVFLISFTSAFEFDNVKSYDEESKIVTITNAFGFGDVIGQARLLSKQRETLGAGYQNVSMFEIWAYDDYNNAIKQFTFTDMRSGKKINRDFDLKKLTHQEVEVNDYETECYADYSNSTNGTPVCGQVISGTHTEIREVWTEITPADLKKNEVLTVGVFTEVKVGDYVDWIPTIYGVEIEEWATWTAALNVDLAAYFKLGDDLATTNTINEVGANWTSSTNTENLHTASGRVNSAFDFVAASNEQVISPTTSFLNGANAFSISVWIKPDLVDDWTGIVMTRGGSQTNGIHLANDDNIRVEAGGGILDSAGGSIVIGNWYHVVVTYDGITRRGYINNVEFDNSVGTTNLVVDDEWYIGFDDFGGRYWDGIIDEVGFWNRSLSTDEITQLFNEGNGITWTDIFGPIINIEYPVNGTTYPGLITQLNYTNSSNSFKCWYTTDAGVTNSSFIDCGTNFTGVASMGGNNIWTVYANDTEGIESSDTTTFFINKTTQTILITPEDNENILNNTIQFNFTSIPNNINLTNATLYIWYSNGTLVDTNFTTLSGNESVNTTLINTIEDGMYKWNAETCGEDIDCSFAPTNNSFIVHVSPIIINISEPNVTIGFIKLGDNQTLTWQLTEPGENLTEHLTNCSFTYNSVITYLSLNTCIVTNTTEFEYVLGINTLIFNTTDIFNLSSSEIRNWEYTIIELNQTFEENVTEGELDDFSLLLNISDGSSLTDATFSYNGTNYTTTIAFSSGLYLISSLIVSPTVEEDTNFSFNFFFVVDDINYSTDLGEQLVLNSLFDICGGISNDTLLNMSIVDEESGLSISGTIEIVAEIISKSSGTIVETINNTFENVEYAAICFTPASAYPSYNLNTEIRYSSDGYVSELYYIQNSDMEGYPRNLTLFDLNQTDSTEFVVTFQNDAFIFVEGAIIQLQRKYIGENVYKVVEAPKTSDGGKAIVHIDLNTNIYRASIVKDGVLLKFFDEIVFSCDNELAGECTEQLRGDVNPNNDIPIETILDFSYSVSVSDENNTVTVLFAIPSGTPSSVNVLLTQTDMFGNITACNNTVITSAGSITCGFSDTIEKSILTLTISKDGTQLAITNYGIDPELDMDGMNFFIVFMFLISLVGMAIASPEWMMIIGVMVFMISGTLLLLTGMSLAMGLGAMAWLVVAVIIIILKMAKQEDR